MSVTIPFSWLKCANCGESLYGVQGYEENSVICRNCNTINTIFVGGGGGYGHATGHTIYMGNGGSGSHSPTNSGLNGGEG